MMTKLFKEVLIGLAHHVETGDEISEGWKPQPALAAS
jgi:hypothetical protein